MTKLDLNGLELLDREDLIAMVKRMVNGGVSLSFHGKRSATLRIPEALTKIIDRLQQDKKWQEKDLVTAVSTSAFRRDGTILRAAFAISTRTWIRWIR